MPLEGYLKTSEAAKFLGLHIDTVGQYIKMGVLKGVREGRLWYIHVDDLVAYKIKRDAALALSTPHKVAVAAREILAKQPNILLLKLYDMIAAQIGIVRTTVIRTFPKDLRAELKKRPCTHPGPSNRKKSTYKRKIQPAKALELYNQGVSMQDIAELHGVTKGHVSYLIKQVADGSVSIERDKRKQLKIVQILALNAQGVKMKDIAKQVELSISQVSRYLKAHKTSQVG